MSILKENKPRVQYDVLPPLIIKKKYQTLRLLRLFVLIREFILAQIFKESTKNMTLWARPLAHSCLPWNSLNRGECY